MSPTQPIDLTCPRCRDAECNPVKDSPFVQCPSCGHGFHPEALARIAERAREKQSIREAEAAFNDSTRRRAPGGSDDGMSMQPDLPLATSPVKLKNGSTVWLPTSDLVVRHVGYGAGRGPRSKKVEPADDWLSVRGLPRKVKSKHLLAAIEAALREESLENS